MRRAFLAGRNGLNLARNPSFELVMRRCIKVPTKAVQKVADQLSAAVDAHIAGDSAAAALHFKAADGLAVFFWLNPGWYDVEANIVERLPADDTIPLAKCDRDPDRNISSSVKREVLARDGYICRYCGLRVVSADIRKIAHRLYPEAVPWNPRDLRRQHAGFGASWLQYDHVIPHSHGGRSSPENIVISCGLCNFGKHNYTLRQLGILNPFDFEPCLSNWDGLERLRSAAKVGSRPRPDLA